MTDPAARGSLPARGSSSRTPAEGSSHARGSPSRSPAEGSRPDLSDSEASPGVALGAVFRVARDDVGMTRDEVADALHLDVAAVAAIEDGRFEALPVRPFVRGYIRNYARILGLDADDLARRFDAADVDCAEPNSIGLRPRVSRKSELALRPLALGYAAIVAILLIALGAVLWSAWRVQDWQFPFLADDSVAPPTETDTTPPSATGSPASPPTVSPWPSVADNAVVDALPDEGAALASPVEPSAGEREGEPLASEEPLAPVAAAVDVEPGPVDAGEDASGPADEVTAEAALVGARVDRPARNGRVGELTVVFDGESWVSVDDATGTRLYGDLGRSGRTISVEGPVPLTVLVGNALAVRIEFDGEPVDLEPFTRENNVARFELSGG